MRERQQPAGCVPHAVQCYPVCPVRGVRSKWRRGSFDASSGVSVRGAECRAEYHHARQRTREGCGAYRRADCQRQVGACACGGRAHRRHCGQHRLDAGLWRPRNHYGAAGRRRVAARAERRIPIFTGGSGLYFKALTAGLAAIPPVPPEIRAAVRSRLEALGPVALHAELSRRDPVMAARLRPADRTRIARALEVVEATGRSIADWQQKGMPPLLDITRIAKIFLAPDRAALFGRIDTRFDAMLSAGALDEVRALAARRLDPLLPAMKAHGVPWLIRYLAGDISLAAAAEAAKQDTRRYAKRQFTWFRHQRADWPRVDPAVARDVLMRDIGR